VKIYTKTGDAGSTGLVGGTRIAKNSKRIAAIGDVDELNAAIGVARLHADADPLMERVQAWLFDLGAELASPEGGRKTYRELPAGAIEAIEQSIDALEADLPPLRSFILPGGSALGASLHLARCVCRRAERSVLELHAEEPVREVPRVFLNRLSDWLFVAARAANRAADIPDVLWTPARD
jgi:cob(I)alamin adenosyltransferase